MASQQPEQPDWVQFLGDSSALAVAPFLSNNELFALSACSRKLLQLRYDLGRWDAVLDGSSYERFRIKRYSVPRCFEGMASFDLVTHLGTRLRIKAQGITNTDALAGVHKLDIRGCGGVTD
ncbi:hypothetical protein B484DRAFT_425450, partial [Ochromonadaceae sp. CCMP2298]